MSILVNKDTRVVTQGIAGAAGLFHAHCARDYGTQMVGGVVPGKGGSRIDGFPVFDSVAQAVQETAATVSVIFEPPAAAAGAIIEAVEAGVELICCITEGLAAADMIEVSRCLRGGKARLIGPNCPGVITPGECKIGIMPGYIHRPGPVGVVSRSGPLTYEAVWQLSLLGIGQSTCVGIGGDAMGGTNIVDCLRMFEGDPATEAVIMIGELGGPAEEEAARYVRERMNKPVAAYMAGRSAMHGQAMGNAGALLPEGIGSDEEKIIALRHCGISVADTPAELAEALLAVYEPE